MTIKQLENKIREYNKAYREGNSLISDNQYDELVEKLREKDPENEIFKKGVIEENEDSYREEVLPKPMYSLEKIKDVKELKRFIKDVWQLDDDDLIVITPKYDGISLLVQEFDHKVWTRGDGEKGFRSDRHFEKIQNGHKDFKHLFPYTFGEVIFPIESFLQHKGSYKSARNCIAGLFNADTPDDMLQYATFVRYGAFDDEDLDKTDQLRLMRESYYFVTWDSTITKKELLDRDDESLLELLNTVFRQQDIFKCDGLVLEVNSAEKRKKLGRLPNMNPRYAIAFKNPEWSEREATIVKKIEWNVSKDGNLKPTLVFDPIDLCGATIQRATAHNAAYVMDNYIHLGAEVVIARSGDVIPKHIETVKYNFEDFQKMCDELTECPCCGYVTKWDSTHTELICTNESCKERKINELIFFYTTLEIENFGEPTIRKFYEVGYTSFGDLLKATPEELMKIEGVGKSLVESLNKQFEELETIGRPFAQILTAFNCFGGVFGEKTCQMIFDALDEDNIEKIMNLEEVSIDDLLNIEGVAKKTAQVFNKGLKKFSKITNYIAISKVQNEKVKAAENQMNVVFTGVRDKELEKELTSKGHIVGSGVSKKTTYLIVKDKNSTSSKMKKAQELGVTIMTLEEFKKEIII